MNGGEVVFHFKGNTDDVDKKTNNLAKDITSKLGSAGKTIGTAFLKGTAVATGALAGLVGASVKGFSEMEQLSGGAKKIFDEMDYSEIEKDAVNAYNKMNMSAQEYLTAINNVGATFASTMGDKKGYDTAKQGLQAISDYATGTGADINLLTEKYKMITRSTSSYLSIADQFAGLLPQTTDGFLKQAQASGYLSSEYKKLTDVPVEEYQQAITNMLEKGVKNMGLLGNTSAEATKTISGSFLATKSALSNFISGAGGVDEVVSSMTNLGTNVVNAINKMAPQVLNGVLEIFQGLAPQLPTLMNSLLPGLITGAVGLMNSLVQQAPTLINILLGMLPQLIQGAVQLTQGLLGAIPQVMQMLVSALPVIINQLIVGLIQLLPQLIVTVVGMIGDIAQAIVSAIPLLIASLPMIISSIITGLINSIPQLVMMGPQLIIGLVTGLISAIPLLVQSAPIIIKQFVDAIISLLPNIVLAGLDLIKSLKEGILNAFNGIPANIKTWVKEKIIDPIKSKGISGLRDVGRNLIEGLWNGIGSMGQWVISKIKGLGKSILNAVKGIFGVHSPSTEFAWVGKMNMVGLKEGMENMQPDLQKTINGMFDLSPNIYGSASTHFSPNINVVVNNNMKQDPLGQMVNDIKTFSGGSKSDYNYVGA